MNSVSSVGGLSNALNSTTNSKQPGPPDHAKAWGWRAKQAAAAEETQTAQTATVTDATATTETPDAVTPATAMDETSQDAAATLPPPDEADMGSVIAGLIAGSSETTTVDASAEYNVVQTLLG
ncbi:hypothetical protein FEE96_18520 [Parasedimentitalea maritima]|uniref:Uncharacterized protein n=1 Tax=Parasedimentitalea maritima TaxID=2578117 RepID=A0ABY2UQX2_9RHOB|nr:hypothetical protein [Zongyanglinia marina]TLP58427.1 hypothetical protein FEE96_18520 [Zongyanglinia marina]